MMMITGLLLRMLINVHFYFILAGTFLCSLGFCFMTGSANKFSILWFPKHQIFFINCVCVFALFASDALGTFFSSYFIRENATKEDVWNFFFIQSIIMIIIQLLMAIFF